VYGVLKGSSCRSILLRQEDLAFFKAISTLQLSPAFLREVRNAMSRRKKPVVSSGAAAPRPGWEQSPHRPSSNLAGKRKVNDLPSSDDSSEPANRPGAGTAPLPANTSSVTGEHAASCSQQLVSPELGVTYAAALVGFVAPLQSNGSLKPTAMDSDPSEPSVSPEAANRRLSSDMSGPLGDMPGGTTASAHVTNTCIPAAEFSNNTQFLFRVYVSPVPSWPGCWRPVLAV